MSDIWTQNVLVIGLHRISKVEGPNSEFFLTDLVTDMDHYGIARGEWSIFIERVVWPSRVDEATCM